MSTLENRALSGHDPVDNGQQTGPASANPPLYQYHKEQQKKKATILRPMMSSAYAPRPAQQKQKIVTHRPKVERANPVDPTARLTRSDKYSLQKRVAYFPEKKRLLSKVPVPV